MMEMHIMPLFQILFSIVYPVMGVVILVLVITWVNKYLALKKEQNDLLREIIQKMERKD